MHKPRTKCRKLFSGVGQIGESSPFCFLRKKKGQNLVEYLLLFLIVAAAVGAMSIYVQRATNARLKQAQEELNYYKDEQRR